MTLYQALALLTPILLGLVALLYKQGVNNKDAIQETKITITRIEGKTDNLEKSIEQLIVPLQQSISNQQAVVEELNNLVNVLDKKLVVIESKVG